MRTIEIALVAIAALTLVRLTRRDCSRDGWLPWLSCLLLALSVAHLVAEGYRWQMIPAYALAAGLLVLVGIGFFRPLVAPRYVVVSGWALLAIAVTAGIVYPVFQLPKPSGSLNVGTTTRYIIDRDRPDTLATRYHGPRELMIQIWYPAKAASGAKRARYLLDARQIDSFWYEQVALVTTHSTLDAPVAEAQSNYPVLIFSPSWHGPRFQNTVEAEDLASHGFIVVGIDHPYSSLITVFPDGRVARAEPTPFMQLSSDNAVQSSMASDERIVKVRVEDVETVLTELQRYDKSGSGDLLSGRLDLNRLGIFGYSFGGAVAAQTCWRDKRFLAGINMDGTMFGEVAEAGIRQPFLFLEAQVGPPAVAQRLRDYLHSLITSPSLERQRYDNLTKRDIRLEGQTLERNGGYRVQIRGVQHPNFSDGTLYSPISYLTGGGPIQAERALRIINAYSLAFFEKYLNHAQEDLLDGPSPEFPEVRLIIGPRPLPASGSSQ